MPPNGVLTPLALLMAERVNEPVTGIEETKPPIRLLKPKATISWLAFTTLPFATKENPKTEEIDIVGGSFREMGDSMKTRVPIPFSKGKK